MTTKSLALKPIVLATLIALSTAVKAEIQIPTNPTHESTVSDQFAALNIC